MSLQNELQVTISAATEFRLADLPQSLAAGKAINRNEGTRKVIEHLDYKHFLKVYSHCVRGRMGLGNSTGFCAAWNILTELLSASRVCRDNRWR
jgi:hypothetical protein